MSDLHDAVASGNLARVKSLIKTDLNQRDAEGRTPLHRAIELEHDDIALALMQSGADATLRVFSSTTPRAGDVGLNALHFAAARGRTTVLRALLDRNGVDINSLGSYHAPGNEINPYAALEFAVGADGFATDSDRFFSADCALALLDAESDPNVACSGGNAAALSLCAYRREGAGTDAERLAVIRALLDRGAVADSWTASGYLTRMQEPLRAAVYTGFYEAAELLIASGAPVNLLEPGRPPPIFYAPHTGRFDLFQLLLDTGADIHALDEHSKNFLHYCAIVGTAAAVPAASQMMRVALARGVNVGKKGRGFYYPDEPEDEGEYEDVTPLHLACFYQAAWAVPLLLEAGADVNAKDGFGYTPLLDACERCGPEILATVVPALVAAGARVDLCYTHDGHSALNVLVVKYMETASDDLNARRCIGTALAALVAAGDRQDLDELPSPCLGLEKALSAVWKDAPEHVPAIFQRLEPAAQRRVFYTLWLIKQRLGDLPDHLRCAMLGAALS